ncbi:MAG TPA: hypothetical protein VE871_03420 [Longimicrobium sp.]|nr:hypothetical protein [Longimicrobium sp.]
MPALQVRLTRRADGGAVLHCDRADGTCTWQRHEGRSAAYFPFHDLTHLAVESVLGFRSGFFGLVAAGWDIADTAGKGARGPLPDEARLVEHLAGLLDRERMGGAAPLTAAELRAQLQEHAATGPVPAITDVQLDAVRTRASGLHGAWAALPPGETLEVRFEPRGPA